MKIKDSSWHDCRNAVAIEDKIRNQMMDEVQFHLLEHPKESYMFKWTGDAFIVGVRMGDEIVIVDSKPLREKTLFMEPAKRAAPKKKAVTKKATAAKTAKKKR